MRNPTRRSRTIGTSKQGHGQNNELVVPYPAVEMKSFYERLTDYRVVVKTINGHTFRFVVETTRHSSFHACTIDDIEILLTQIPEADYGNLELIVLRQPTRKEENLKAVWGRLIYSYEFENDYFPAIILEAVDLKRTLKWPRKITLDAQKELDRLIEDGHPFERVKRFYEAKLELSNIRSTQLYRTLLHEFGHYVHYLEIVERVGMENEDFDEWEKRSNFYHSLPTSEKEVFAHSYSDKLNGLLREKEIIPFDRIINKKSIVDNKLNIHDFISQL